MSEDHFDEFEHYNFEEKLVNGGKQRSKKEASEHKNKHDPCGHTRKLVTKMQNTEANRKEGNAKGST